MRTLRRNAGQTAAEYLGALLVVSVIVAAIATSDVGISVAREVSRLVCVIGGGTDCEREAAEAVRPQVREYENQHGDRRVYDAEDGSDLPGERVRRNGDGPTGDDETDAVHENFGVIFDYFQETFGRRSFDDNGSPLIATINWRDPEHPDEPFRNAYWSEDLKQMVFGRDYAAPLDVTAHEVTHGITNNEIGLPYEGEHGALSEAISDIFASNIDTGRLGDRGGPAQRRDPRHGASRALRRSRPRRRLPRHRPRPRRRAHQQRDPEQGLREHGRPHRARRLRADRLRGRHGAPRLRLGLRGLPQRLPAAAADRYGRTRTSTGACGGVRRRRPRWFVGGA